MILNHINIINDGVADLARFFEQHFGFRLTAVRGTDAFAVLEGEGGVVLNLMKPGKTEIVSYPENFHVGFVVDGAQTVMAKHEELDKAGARPGEVQTLTRGGAKTVCFYCRAPGGFWSKSPHRLDAVATSRLDWPHDPCSGYRLDCSNPVAAHAPCRAAQALRPHRLFAAIRLNPRRRLPD